MLRQNTSLEWWRGFREGVYEGVCLIKKEARVIEVEWVNIYCENIKIRKKVRRIDVGKRRKSDGRSQGTSCPTVGPQIIFDCCQQANPHTGTFQFTIISYSMNIFANYIGFKIFPKCIAYVSPFLNLSRMINLSFFWWLKDTTIDVNSYTMLPINYQCYKWV